MSHLERLARVRVANSLLVFLQLACLLAGAAAGSSARNNNNDFPFKTSFVSASDQSIRRSAGLVAIPMGSEIQLAGADELAGGGGFEAVDEELSWPREDAALAGGHPGADYQAVDASKRSAAIATDGAQGGFKDSRLLQQSAVAQHYGQPELLDLMAASSAQTSSDVHSGANLTDLTQTASTQTTTTSTTTTTTPSTPTPTTTSTTQTVQTTTLSPSSISSTAPSSPSKTESRQTSADGANSTSSTAEKHARASLDDSSPATTTTAVQTSQQTDRISSSSDTSSTSLPSTTFTSTPSPSPSPESASASPTTVITTVARLTTTTTTTSSPNEISNLPSASFSSMRTSRVHENGSLREARWKANEADANAKSERGHLDTIDCMLGSANCTYIVGIVPVVENWNTSETSIANRTRLVNEFVFVPADSSLSFEDSAYSTRRPDKQVDEATLKAEHRAGDMEADGSSGSDDIELDYIISDADSLRGEVPSTSRPQKIVMHQSTVAPVRSTSTTSAAPPPSSPPPPPTTTTTTTTTAASSTTTPTSTMPTSITTSTTSTTRRPTSATQVSQSTSFTVRVSPVSSSPAPTRRFSSSTTTTSTTSSPESSSSRQPPLLRQTQKISRIVGQSRSSAGTREPNQQQQPTRHRQFFNEPARISRRPAVGNDFSPTANGADEEEAKILTRLSAPTQLSRLSGSGATQAPQTARRASWSRFAATSERAAVSSLSSQSPSPNQTVVVNSSPTLAVSSTTRRPNERSVTFARKLDKVQVQTGPTNAPTRSSAPTSSAQVRSTTGRPSLARTKDSSAIQSASSDVDRETKMTSEQLTSRLEEMMTLIASSEGQASESKSDSVSTTSTASPSSSTSTTTVAPVSSVGPLASLIIEDYDLRQVNQPRTQPTEVKRPREQLIVRQQFSGSQRSPASANTSTTGGRKFAAVDDYEGSVEDQLAKDAIHSRAPSSSGSIRSNTYGSSRAVHNARLVNPSSSSDRPEATEADEGGASGQQLPGRPGIDYPTHWEVPKTSFDCRNYDQSGFYADTESDCQAYHSCHKGRGGRHTFLCPNGTLFSQELLTCDWWYNVECSASKLYMPGESSQPNASVGGSVSA